MVKDTKARAAEWLAAKNSGATFAEIARKAGVSRQHVHHVVTAHSDYQPGLKRHASVLIETVRQLRAEGLTAAEVGQRLGMSRDVVLGVCRRHLKGDEREASSP